jgi:ribonuclease Z
MTSKIKIHFLGTADAIPSERRNHLAVLLNYEGENILFDCGEGTQRQIRKAKLNPCKITKILISHWHGDHVLGLAGLLSTLSLSGYNKTLNIYGPKGFKRNFEDMIRLFHFEKTYKINVEEVLGRFFENEDFYLEAAPVDHTISCNSYNFVKKATIRIDKAKLKKYKIKEGPHLKEIKKGKDITYEGKKYKAKDLIFEDKGKKVSFIVDTKYKKELYEFAKEADLVIAESTFSAELEKEAQEKMHLTSQQAAEIAKKSKSKKLVLIHLSARYEANTKQILDEAKKVFKDTVIVKDLDVLDI